MPLVNDKTAKVDFGPRNFTDYRQDNQALTRFPGEIHTNGCILNLVWQG